MKLSPLSHSQMMRYNRQVVLPQIDLDGQERLAAARVAVIGVGGLGNAAITSLVASGVGQVTLIDNDTVDATNLPRQTLFTDGDVDIAKVNAAHAALKRLNPSCSITPHATSVDKNNAGLLLGSHDIVLDCTDNKAARIAVNHACVTHSIALVSGAAIRFEGQIFVGHPSQAPCYGCLGALFAEPELSCTEAGIFSPVASVIGTYQAMLAMQIITGAGDIPYGKLLCFDALHHVWQTYTVPRAKTCNLCETR